MRLTATASYSGAGRRVLVCDDERNVVRLIQVNLERQGHKVVCAYDGQEAVNLLETSGQPNQPKFDAVVLDVMMPKLDGMEVLKWIRTHEHTKSLWVALMLARLQNAEVFEQYEYRADKYVVKPFDPADLFGLAR